MWQTTMMKPKSWDYCSLCALSSSTDMSSFVQQLLWPAMVRLDAHPLFPHVCLHCDLCQWILPRICSAALAEKTSKGTTVFVNLDFHSMTTLSGNACVQAESGSLAFCKGLVCYELVMKTTLLSTCQIASSQLTSGVVTGPSSIDGQATSCRSCFQWRFHEFIVGHGLQLIFEGRRR